MPCRYCPVNEINHLPVDVIRKLDSYEQMFHLVQPIKACLCSSVGAAQIPCDPGHCSELMAESMPYVLASDNPKAAMGGVGKRIYRSYVKSAHVGELKVNEEVNDFLDSILDV